jgi:hypothetical protein
MDVWHDPEAIKKFLASEELTHDPEYMASMDSAWHYWQQPKYDKCRNEWEEKQKGADTMSADPRGVGLADR